MAVKCKIFGFMSDETVVSQTKVTSLPQLAEAWKAACLHQRRARAYQVAGRGEDDQEEDEGVMRGPGDDDAPAASMVLGFDGFLDLLGR